MKFKTKPFLEDLVNIPKSAVATAGCGLSTLGLEYISQQVYGKSLQDVVTPETIIYSKEALMYGAQLLLATGTVAYGVACTYFTAKFPIKLITGQYFKR